MSEKLTPAALAAALPGLPHWQHDAAAATLTRAFRFRDFSEAFGFMARVALLAERAGHHPDWSNSYNRVEIALKTHDKDAVTQKDIDLATAINAL